ncbi:ribose-5-phosphate isomerase RpiA [Halobacteria archaeon AArc-m2/3/4]|uniref:Ribose-5-phosphate isomerase A n=1 Tax=Natronoglomus mannanivorans TaxID=2979990 RepID=A0ABT2QAJ1_9EURY|nr:ribose-5-phosphate isomerase RpiA [Halobacteria archaeon AArc-m2/3/4]
MKTGGGSDEAKRRAGERAAEAVEDGSVVGLGTGSTTAFAIEAIGRAIDDGLEVRGIPTSFQSRQLAIDCDIPLTSLDEVLRVDLAIDGADQVSEAGDLIKGGGAAQTREKLVAAAADRFVVVADPSKLSARLERSVPIEVVPDAHTVVAKRVRELEPAGEPTLREASQKDGPVVTDNGNLMLDCEFGSITDPETLATQLSNVPGVVEHGLFVGMADAVYVGTDDGLEVRRFESE